ncbi:DUF1127 domain-containing protein [Bradyrhizobium sp. USDA 4461]
MRIKLHFSKLLTRLVERRRCAKLRRALRELDDHQLRDIGVDPWFVRDRSTEFAKVLQDYARHF